MAPDTVFGETSQVDERADVYSLGAMMHVILTGELPFPFSTVGEWLGGLAKDAPRRARDVDPAVPEVLSRICETALALERDDRYAEAGALAEAIRAWQREHAVEREVEVLWRDAETTFAATEGLAGEDLLRQLDRVTAVTSRILELRPDHRAAMDLVHRSEDAREQAIGERERAARNRVLKRVAAAGLAIGLVLAVVIALLVDARRQEAEGERQRADAERDAKAEALANVLRLADSKTVRDLVAEADDLWPIHPDTAPAMKAWIDRAKVVIANRRIHENALAAVRDQARPYAESERLRDHAAEIASLEESRKHLSAVREEIDALGEDESEEVTAKRETLGKRAGALETDLEELARRVASRKSWAFSDRTMAWRHEVLRDLAAGLATLADGEDARLGKAEARLALSEALAPASTGKYGAEWARTIAAIADRELNPRYEGLRIQPVPGLIPRGRDPRSKLFEFAHVGSGSVPERDPETGELVQEEDAAIVLVLIPGGTFWMGAQEEDRKRTNFDPQASSDESPVHEVRLSPYLIAKYECTQAQWAAMTGGERPSRYGPGQVLGGKTLTDRNPVEQVSWEDATRWLGRHRLVLPTESRWEHACRADTGTPWFTGDDVAALSDVANVADAFCKANGGEPDWSYTEEVNDGHVVHAPVGSLAPNGFGLHDVHGNVVEWCQDVYVNTYAGAPEDGSARRSSVATSRVLRSGSWSGLASWCRSANRFGGDPGLRNISMGFRAAAKVR